MDRISYSEHEIQTLLRYEMEDDKMKRIRQLLEEKKSQLWLLFCLGFIGFLYLASITLLTARMLFA